MALHLFILVIVTFLSGCTKLSPKEENYFRVAAKTDNEIRRYLLLESNGKGAMMPKQILAYVGDFSAKGPLSVQQARWLIIHASQIALDNFNKDAQVQEYLIQRPFQSDNLVVSISFINLDNNKSSMILVAKGKLSLSEHFPELRRYETLFRENYEDALQKVEGQPYPQ